ncbi:DUF5713 family protein [Nocardiopsis sp. CC223A]|uniref:DUF5713 family protein n=1 Tax=Nocardiopsis sp. CC223A TaxID=3044051 RepID=UPI00278C725A|nr:DUF5713 family protein [Nocardiopsis sp. CC223A]
MPVTNTAAEHVHLEGMEDDPAFPDHLIGKGRSIPLAPCERIEADRPPDLSALYLLTNAATAEFNALQKEFWAMNSDTVIRESIAVAFMHVMNAYGCADADLEEALAPRGR